MRNDTAVPHAMACGVDKKCDWAPTEATAGGCALSRSGTLMSHAGRSATHLEVVPSTLRSDRTDDEMEYSFGMTSNWDTASAPSDSVNTLTTTVSTKQIAAGSMAKPADEAIDTTAGRAVDQPKPKQVMGAPARGLTTPSPSRPSSAPGLRASQSFSDVSTAASGCVVIVAMPDALRKFEAPVLQSWKDPNRNLVAHAPQCPSDSMEGSMADGDARWPRVERVSSDHSLETHLTCLTDLFRSTEERSRRVFNRGHRGLAPRTDDGSDASAMPGGVAREDPPSDSATALTPSVGVAVDDDFPLLARSSRLLPPQLRRQSVSDELPLSREVPQKAQPSSMPSTTLHTVAHEHRSSSSPQSAPGGDASVPRWATRLGRSLAPGSHPVSNGPHTNSDNFVCDDDDWLDPTVPPSVVSPSVAQVVKVAQRQRRHKSRHHPHKVSRDPTFSPPRPLPPHHGASMEQPSDPIRLNIKPGWRLQAPVLDPSIITDGRDVEVDSSGEPHQLPSIRMASYNHYHSQNVDNCSPDKRNFSAREHRRLNAVSPPPEILGGASSLPGLWSTTDGNGAAAGLSSLQSPPHTSGRTKMRHDVASVASPVKSHLATSMRASVSTASGRPPVRVLIGKPLDPTRRGSDTIFATASNAHLTHGNSRRLSLPRPLREDNYFLNSKQKQNTRYED